MNKKLLLIIALGTAFAVGESLAQNRPQGRGFGPPGDDRGGFGGQRGGPPGGRGGFGGGQRPNMMSFLPVLKALDADGNGEISAAEMANAAAALKSLDKNGDGKLTEDEVRPQGPPGGGQRGGPPGGDRGGDRGSFGGPPQGGDNFGPPRGGRENMDRGGRGFGGPPGQGDQGQGNRPGAPDPAEMVKRLMAFDKNGDGKLGKDELSSRMQSLITRADKNGDGYADEQELMKLAEGQGGGGRSRGGFGNRGNQRDAPPEDGRPKRPEFDN